MNNTKAASHPLIGAQYLKSDHPDVLAAIERNRATLSSYYDQADAFVRKYRVGNADSDTPRWNGEGWFGRGVHAIESAQKPTAGQWTRGPGGRGWRPFKNNPVYAEMTAIGFQFESYPGLPSEVEGARRADGATTIYFLHPFAHDGVGWVDCRERLTGESAVGRRRGMPDPALWSEVKASDFYAAKEALEAERVAR